MRRTIAATSPTKASIPKIRPLTSRMYSRSGRPFHASTARGMAKAMMCPASTARMP